MILSGTGHRLEVLGGYTVDVHYKVIAYARMMIDAYKPSTVICGMAPGWDTAIAIATLDYEIPLIAAIPFIGQDHVWKQHQKDLYQRILKHASVIKIISEGGYATHKYHVRDQWMVDNGQGVLALWNGQKHGGTYSAVKYAKQVEKPIYNVWPGWESFEFQLPEGCPCGCKVLDEQRNNRWLDTSFCWHVSEWV